MTNQRWTLTPALLLPLLGLACGDGGADSGGAQFAGTVTDSAGIEIVHNTATGMWPDGGGWTTAQLMQIGEAAGDADYQFGQIAAVGALSDGRIAVLDQQAQRIQVYGPDGTYQESIGGPGNGPGEFSQAVTSMFVGRGDTLVVPDMGNQRIMLIPPTGDPSSFPMRIEQGIPIRFDMTADGLLVSQRRAMNFGGDATETSPTDLILEQRYDGSVVDTLLTPKRGETFEITRGGPPKMTLFAPEPAWTMLSEDRLAFAVSDAYRISVFGADGDLQRVIEFPHEARPVSESDKETVKKLIRRLGEQQGAPPQALDQYINSIGFAEYWPAFTQMRSGPQGTLWVQRTRTLDNMTDEQVENWNPQLDQGTPRWDVFETDGRYGGVIELPTRFTPLTIAEDRIYGVYRDDFDVQYVRVYRLDTGTEIGDV
jgi:hypothetical protein